MKHQYYIVSEIVSLGDDINKKGKAVNKCLKEICKLTMCSYWNRQMQFLVHTLIEVSYTYTRMGQFYLPVVF